MLNSSDKLRNLILKRQHYLARFENGTIRELIAPYVQAREEVLSKLYKLEESGVGATLEWRISRLNAQLAEIEQVLNAASSASSEILGGRSLELAASEADATTSIINSQVGSVGLNIVNLPYKHIDYVVANPLLGESIGERFLWANRDATRMLKQELVQSAIQGDSMATAAKRLMTADGTGVVDALIRNRADMIARSELQYIANQVNRSIYRNNQDIIKGVQFVATLDSRTCLRCANLDGTVFPFIDGEDHRGPILPLHVRCRCVYAPVIKSWRELGIDADEFPDSTRASFNGQVSETNTYAQWFRQQSDLFQLDALGPARYDLWKSGRLPLSQMVTDNRILSLDELSRITGMHISDLDYGFTIVQNSTNAKVLDFITKNPSVGKAEIAVATGLKEKMVSNSLYTLKKNGYVTSKAGRYSIVNIDVPKIKLPKVSVAKVIAPSKKLGDVVSTKERLWRTFEELANESDKLISDTPVFKGLSKDKVWQQVRSMSPLDTPDDLRWKLEIKDALDREFYAYVEYGNYLDANLDFTERRRLISNLCSASRGKRTVSITETVEGTSHIKFDLLADLSRNGYEIKWNARTGRANFNHNIYNAKSILFDNNDNVTVAHETGHAIDSFFAGGAEKFTGNLGYWKTNRYVGEAHSVKYRQWFERQKTGGMSYYQGRRDERIYNGNWLSNYEGRDYGGGTSAAAEFFSMNSQRYNNYYVRATNKIENLKQYGVDLTKEEIVKEYNKIIDEALNVSSSTTDYIGSWSNVRYRYPELAMFMENLYRPLPTIEELFPEITKETVKAVAKKVVAPTVKEVATGITDTKIIAGSTNDVVLKLISKNPGISVAELTAQSGLKTGQVRNAIYKLKIKLSLIKAVKGGLSLV